MSDLNLSSWFPGMFESYKKCSANEFYRWDRFTLHDTVIYKYTGEWPMKLQNETVESIGCGKHISLVNKTEHSFLSHEVL